MKFSKAEIEAIIAASPRKFVPLNKLVLSTDYQARMPGTGSPTAPQLSITELAASIREAGVLQNLVVVEGPRGIHEVCAGGRRLASLELLVSNGSIPENYPVPVLVVPADQALIASLAENCFHVPMHPADEYSAFAKLIDQGKSVEDVAAAFGVTALVVKRRMKLGTVSPKLMMEYRKGENRKGEINLECLMVLASIDDHQRQEDAWRAAPAWNRNPSYLRQLLTQGEAESDTDPIARFVSLKTYEKAGGPLRRDLFSDSDKKAYLLDIPLLERLATEKLQRRAKPLLAEGWKWVDVRVRFNRDEFIQHGELRKTRRTPTPEEAQTLDDIQNRLDELNTAMENWRSYQGQGEGDDEGEGVYTHAEGEPSDDEDETDPGYQALENEAETLLAQLKTLQENLCEWSPELKAQAGCVIFVDQRGEPSVRYGLIRPEDREVMIEAVKQASMQTDPTLGLEALASQPGTPPRPEHSERLMRKLTAHRVAAIQAELVQQPHVAIAALTAQLAIKAFGQDYEFLAFDETFDVKATCNHYDLVQAAEDLQASAAWSRLQQEREQWRALVPNRPADFMPWLLAQPPGVVLKLLVFLIAITAKGVYGSEPETQCNDALAEALGLDMRAWWSVSADSYLNHVSKGRIVEVVTQAVDAPTANTLQTMKKTDAVAAAEMALTGKGWLPAVLRVGANQNTAAQVKPSLESESTPEAEQTDSEQALHEREAMAA
jgi:ParB family transcriptional regulator, chromosome partitioning protein